MLSQDSTRAYFTFFFIIPALFILMLGTGILCSIRYGIGKKRGDEPSKMLQAIGILCLSLGIAGTLGFGLIWLLLLLVF